MKHHLSWLFAMALLLTACKTPADFDWFESWFKEVKLGDNLFMQ